VSDPLRFLSWLAELRGRMRALFRRGAMERDLAEEIQLHLDLET
jgi:hypothetical protein